MMKAPKLPRKVRPRVGLDPAEHLMTSFRLVANQMKRIIQPERMVLGGGSLLESKWQHRQSTDLDFFIPSYEMVNVIRDLETKKVEMERFAEWMGRYGECFTSGQEGAKGALIRGNFRGVDYTVYESDLLILRRKEREKVGRTAIGWANVEEVLTGKVGDRWVKDLKELGEDGGWCPPVRDLYDIAVAQARQPVALETVVEALSLSERAMLQKGLEKVDESELEEDGKEVLKPTYEVDCYAVVRGMGQAMATGSCKHVPVGQPMQMVAQNMGMGM